MLFMSSYAWPFWVAFYCWCAVALTGGRTWISVDSSSSEADVRPTNKVSHCLDHIKNEDETDIDCGGIKCPKCGDTNTCKDDCDCISNICKNKRCISSESCDDHIKNQDETDVDCGGIKCPRCEDKNTCKNDCDCISGACKNNKCVPFESCDDKIKNQDETDVDCGGIKCPKCEDWKACKDDCDCIGGTCNSDHICTVSVTTSTAITANSSSVAMSTTTTTVTTSSTTVTTRATSVASTTVTSTTVTSTTATSTTVTSTTATSTSTTVTTTTATSTTVTSTTATSTSTTVTTTSTTVTTTSIQYRWNPTGITVAGVTVSAGTSANLLTYPCGIVLDSSKTLYIADSGSHRVQRWLFNASSGTTVAGQMNGAAGPTLNHLSVPSDVTVDTSGNVYIVDTYNHRVLRWTAGAPSGTLVAGTGFHGSANNMLNNPRGIARDSSSGTLYIADYYNHRVMRYLFGASSGTVVAGGNGPGSANTQLNLPIGLYFDSSSNSLLIANSGAHNIVRWIIGAPTWTLVAGSISGTSGSTSTLLSQPQDVALDSMGNVYVADGYNHRVQFFSAGQFTGITIAGIGTASSTATGLYLPSSVAVDAQLNLYVSDYQNLRVQKFQRY